MDKDFWKSKKFWVMVVAALVPSVNELFNIGLSVAEVSGTVGPLMAYILGQGLADLGKNKK